MNINLYSTFGIKLSKTQKQHVGSICWLLDDVNFRQEGRTTLLAVVYLNKALDNPGQRVYVRDHHPNEQANSQLRNKIECIIGSQKCPLTIKESFNRGPDWISFYPGWGGGIDSESGMA